LGAQRDLEAQSTTTTTQSSKQAKQDTTPSKPAKEETKQSVDTSSTASKSYHKPTEHGGKKVDGTWDLRTTMGRAGAAAAESSKKGGNGLVI
jgi:hypothetical protein